jgi:crotonobetainyl-CoA:carnitine CoA-transferase CaiB-like acyl-CoA transferase
MTSGFGKYRVLDLSEGVAGPYATRMLAGYGFDVIKVEPPGGEWTRGAGPFPIGEPDPELSGLFLYLNVGKRSVTIDLETEDGRALVCRLAETADVIVESRGPGGLEQLGLSYDALAERRPSVVVTSISPFGLYGPNSHYQGSEIVLQAMSGFLYRNGRKDAPPLKQWGYLAQLVGGIDAACATTAAIVGARLHGRGHHIDLSIQEAMLQFLHGTLMRWVLVGQVAPRGSNLVLAIQPLLPTADGEIQVTGGKVWAAMADSIDDARLKDPKFDTTEGRLKHKEELNAILIENLTRLSRTEAFHMLSERGVPVGYVRSAKDVLESEHERDRGFFKSYPNSRLGSVEIPGSPFIMSEVEWAPSGPPELGKHTREVLVGVLGMSDAELDALQIKGVIS